MKPLLSALFCVACFAGCLTGGEITPTVRYALEPPLTVSAGGEPIGKTIGIRPLEAARPYREAMVYLDEGNVLGQRVKEAWADRPDAVVTRAIADALAATGRFADVGDAANMARPDYQLTGEVRFFRENRTASPWVGEVEVRLELREALDVRQPWSATLRKAVPMADETGASAADALALAVSHLAADAAQAITAAVP